MSNHPADVFLSIADEPEIKKASILLPQVAHYEICETIDGFNRMMGLPSLESKAHPDFVRRFRQFQKRFHRGDA
jgi:hypothetical protein